MANQITNRTVNIYIESGQAQKALDALIKKETALKNELQEATNPKRIEHLKNELHKLEEPLERARKKVSGELSPSFKDVQKIVNDLGNRLRRMSEEDADYSTVLNQYRQANKELDAQRGKIGILSRAMKTFWQEAKTVAVGVIVGNTVQSALQTVLGYVTGIVTGSAKIADELSDIEKTTGLTGDQVKVVNKELSKIDTRTSREELRKLASEAGKLGEDSVEGVTKFVDQADKIRVALKEDLGEDAILDMAKTSKIFNVEMLNMASAINEVGASSEASEAYAVDFLKRTGATAATVKIAAGDVLGYSAALEIAGQTTEVSATALNTFFLDFVSNLDKFGKAAGFADGELQQLIKDKGTNEGFLQFLERLKTSQPEAAGFINKLRELGIDGARGSNVMLSLANNITRVREQQKIAGDAIKSTNSIMDEFNKKNNNAAAELDKFRKNFAGLFQSETFLDAGRAAIVMMNSFINILKESFRFISDHKLLLASLAAIYVLVTKSVEGATVAKIKNAAVTRTKIMVAALEKAAIAASVAAQLTYGAVVDLVTKKITLATAAKRIWSAVTAMGAGPLGILLVAVGGLVVGLQSLIGATKKLTAEQKLQADVSERVANATSETVNKIQILTQVASDNNKSLEDRKKALNALIAINPQYLQGLTTENLKTAEGTKIIQNYVEHLKAKAEVEAKYAVLQDRLREKQRVFDELRRQNTGYEDLSDSEIEKEVRRIANTSINLFTDGTKKGYIEGYRDLVEGLNTINKLQTEVANFDTQKLIDALGGATNSIKESASAAGESIDSLKAKLKSLQESRDAATDDKSRADLNKQIQETEAKIAAMEGRSSKAATNAQKQINQGLQDLIKWKQEVHLASLSPLERELELLDERHSKILESVSHNKNLVTLLYQVHGEARLRLIRDFARQEVEEWKKGQNEIFKKSDEAFKKNIEGLKHLSNGLINSLQAVDNIDRNRIASKELAILRSSGKVQLNARLDLLNEQQRQEEQALAERAEKENLTVNQIETERALIEEQYRQKRGEAEMSYWTEFLGNLLNFASQAMQILDIVGNARTERENAELEADRKRNEAKKNNLAGRLKSGLVTQLQYDREVRKMEAEQEKREKAVRLKQFKRDQRAQIVQALMNGAQGVLSVLAARPGSTDIISLGLMRAINIGLTVATTAAQVAAIASRKPPEYGYGGILNGPAHSDRSKGMPVVHPYTGQVQAYLEGGEGIGSKKTMKDSRRYNVSGTPSQIFSLLNGVNGGVQWTSGAILRPAWSNQRPMPMNYQAINSSIGAVKRFYAGGGKFEESNLTTPSANQNTSLSTEMIALMRDMIESNNAMREEIASLRENGVTAYTLLSDQEKQSLRLRNVKLDASLKVR